MNMKEVRMTLISLCVIKFLLFFFPLFLAVIYIGISRLGVMRYDDEIWRHFFASVCLVCFCLVAQANLFTRWVWKL
ncbi:hypothetical protein QBC36DRAFT_141430 [Triangularia setosa]|uniref:Uncharacterized protein n=1 Tax=Triangularia setosa TaxID=2587417 RepID=A0AAN7A891_9PEZI|nr:hypothetical protein QBC36DRAFT_141430 [Podospora setosa]